MIKNVTYTSPIPPEPATTVSFALRHHNSSLDLRRAMTPANIANELHGRGIQLLTEHSSKMVENLETVKVIAVDNYGAEELNAHGTTDEAGNIIKLDSERCRDLPLFMLSVVVHELIHCARIREGLAPGQFNETPHTTLREKLIASRSRASEEEFVHEITATVLQKASQSLISAPPLWLHPQFCADQIPRLVARSNAGASIYRVKGAAIDLQIFVEDMNVSLSSLSVVTPCTQFIDTIGMLGRSISDINNAVFQNEALNLQYAARLISLSRSFESNLTQFLKLPELDQIPSEQKTSWAIKVRTLILRMEAQLESIRHGMNMLDTNHML